MTRIYDLYKVRKQKLLLIILVLFFAGAEFYPQDLKQDAVPKNQSALKPDAFGGNVKRRFYDKNGDEILVINVPGKPPDKFRMQAAKMPSTAKTIAGVPAYDWSFGCTATSAAMIAAYYDNNGYPNLYTGPTNGGAAPATNASWGTVTINGEVRSLCPIAATKNGLDGRTTRGHVDDYWIKYGNCDNDPYITNGWGEHAKGDCTGDFMWTNQSAADNCDGSTTIYYYENGNIYAGADNGDGTYGFELFLESKGYTVTTRYNQLIYGYGGNTRGFTFAQYKQEIDNGYPVFIHVVGHTMVGIGYDDATNKVYLHDTWDYSTHEMTWGGSYSGMQHWGVAVIHLAPAVPSYTISAVANPLAGGTVAGTGTYNQGATASLTATANPGYTFVNWTESGVQVSTSAAYSFSVNSNRTLTANFSQNLYTITTGVTPSGTGTASGGGNFTYGQTATLQAAAANGYSFVKWTENGAQVSTAASYSFSVTSNRNLIANFAVANCVISASANPSGGGSISGTGTYASGQSIQLIATPNAGYYFVNWTENGAQVSTNAAYSFTVSSSRALIANFAKISYTITLNRNPVAGGSVSGAGSFYYGSADSLIAVPNAGYAFVNWTENGNPVSANPVFVITVTGNRTLTANFSQNTYTITTASNPANGGATSGGGTFVYGQTDTVKAFPNTGFSFINWTVNGQAVSTNPVYAFTVTGSGTLTANFGPAAAVITTVSSPANGGVTYGGGTFSYGQVDTVRAVANTGYSFFGWSENGSLVSSSAAYVFTVTGNRTLTANFVAGLHTITTIVSPPNSGTVTGGGGCSYGQSDTLRAFPNTGFSFVSWTENGQVVSTNPVYVFTVTGDRTLTANFSLSAFTITAVSNPANGGSISGSGSFTYGQVDTVKAIPNAGYSFVNWTENQAVISVNQVYSFTVTSNRAFTANFSQNSYTVTTASNPQNGGTTSGGGSFVYGQTDTVKAVANSGFTFANWQENGQIVSSNQTYIFTVTGSRALTANFSRNSFTITAGCNPVNSGIITGAGIHFYGEIDTLRAIPNNGYTFVYWTENGSVVSSSSEYIFTVTSNRNLVANFSQDVYTINLHASPAQGGTVTGGGTFTFGQIDTAKAVPAAGYSFVNWTENGNVVSTNASYIFTVTASRVLTANFSQTLYPVSVEVNPLNGGSVTGAGNYAPGQSARLEAIPAPGYAFLNWTENGNIVSTDAILTFTVTSSRALKANFYLQNYTITVVANPANGGVVTGSGNFTYGQIDTIKAVSNNGYIFLYWTENGNVLSSNSSYVITVNGNRTIFANFSQTSSYSVNLLTNPVNGGTVTGAGAYTAGVTDTVKAVPNIGYVFKNWSENGIVVSVSPVYSFVVTANKILTANFASLSLTSPEGGENWYVGSSHNITWNQTNVDNVKLEYSLDNGQTWKTITASTPAPVGSYWWTIPAAPTLTARVRITDVAIASLSSASPAPFSIIDQANYASITLGTVNAQAGDSILIPLSGKKLTGVGAISLKIQFDSSKISFGRIVNTDSQLSGLLAGSSGNTVSVSWFGLTGADFADKKMLDLKFLYKGSADSVQVKFVTSFCEVSDVNLSIIPVQFINGCVKSAGSLSGDLLYANSSKTPIDGAKVFLKNPVLVIDSTVTDQAGHFSFANKPAGVYKFGFSINKTWGGANSTDALLIARSAVQLITLDSLHNKAADVNLSGVVNATDALLVLKRSALLINTFAAGDWVYEEPVIIYAGGDLNKIIYCLAAGDVNSSYNPLSTAKSLAERAVKINGNGMYKDRMVDIPVYLTESAKIGAACVSLTYDESLLKITGLESALPGMVYNLSGGKISFAWADIKGAAINKNAPLFTIKARLLKTVDVLTLNALPDCEFADIAGEKIEGLKIGSLSSVSGTPVEFELCSNYPNPFNPSTAIKFSVPQDELVTLAIYDMLGREVKTLLSENRKAGSYTVNWNGDDNRGHKVSSGVYIYKLTAGQNAAVKKMNLLK
jgi:uncharacterized repeat protein (TIGR02543 family)